MKIMPKRYCAAFLSAPMHQLSHPNQTNVTDKTDETKRPGPQYPYSKPQE